MRVCTAAVGNSPLVTSRVRWRSTGWPTVTISRTVTTSPGSTSQPLDELGVDRLPGQRHCVGVDEPADAHGAVALKVTLDAHPVQSAASGRGQVVCGAGLFAHEERPTEVADALLPVLRATR